MRCDSSNFLSLLGLVILISMVACDVQTRESDSVKKNRGGKFLPVFQVVTFHNNVCASNSGGRNGTCYTSDECNDLGGSNAGSCADGFGVCCVFSLACGESSSQNCTFLVQKSVTSVPDGKCEYKICKCSSNICRIRLDFSTFEIAGPESVPTVAAVDATAVPLAAVVMESVGDCMTDRFSATSSGNVGTPVICGYNTGQHIYVDASDDCNALSFDISGGDSSTRSWDIKVTQYKCGDDFAGDDGCLQYHTGASGTISSFNFPTNSAMVGATATHLSNQHYNICIRRESGYCAICYIAAISPTASAVTDQASFGLSLITVAMADHDSSCSTDYITIPVGMKVTTADGLVLGKTDTTTLGLVAERFCGRALSATDADIYVQANSVCSQSIPFRVGVQFDQSEEAMEDLLATGGIVGFSLNYKQISC